MFWRVFFVIFLIFSFDLWSYVKKEEKTFFLKEIENKSKLLKIYEDKEDRNYCRFIFLLSFVEIESQFNPKAISYKNAIGLMQIKKSTAEWIVKKYGLKIKNINLFNPDLNLLLGVLYLNFLWELFGDEEKMIMAYNMGKVRFCMEKRT